MGATNMIEFLRICGKLKQLKRTGWVNNQVQLPESVADHMYRMAMCCMLIDETKDQVDKARCIKMAIVHDLAEALVGDITPHDGVSNEDKHQREANAMEKICQTLGDTSTAREIFALWNEYEQASTPEALMVKDFDKFEMILQADEYEQSQGKDLQDFFNSTQDYFQTPLVKAWDKQLREERLERQTKPKE